MKIDSSSSTPPFEQLKTQLIGAIASGQLAAGARLPTVRMLAVELGLAANTVARAYRELEANEIIETRGRNGSFVSAYGDITQRQAQLAARAYADRIHALGVSAEDAVALAASALRS
jgi:DNA-binding transcriptional regulator YhcF (GntR family)